MPLRIPDPPSSITGPLGEWLRLVTTQLRRVPTVSYFSGTTPESAVSGQPGDFAIGLGSASTNTRLFVKAGALGSFSTVSWMKVHISAA